VSVTPAGVTVIRVITGFTVRNAFPTTAPIVAFTVSVPTASIVATPPDVMLATLGSLRLQVKTALGIALPRASCAAATKVCVVPR